MTTRAIAQLIQARPLAEGAGVIVHRTIGTPALRNLDPFLMLDHFGSDNPNEYIAGFPDHPHRGFITLTYMLDGRMLHEDSMGNRGDLEAGGIQWMKAASGVIHSEMPQQTDGLMRGFQLWINLPAAEKMSAPAYQEFAAGLIPSVSEDGAEIRVICGRLADVNGPIHDPHTAVFYYDVALEAGRSCTLEVPREHQAFVYCFEGRGKAGATATPNHSLAVLTPGDRIELSAADLGARFIAVGGKPLNEPIVQYGPFVMNTQREIEVAFADYQAGRLVQQKAAFVTER